MAPSKNVGWTDVALAGLQLGAQALLDESNSKLGGPAPDFGEVDQLMREIAQKTFLQTYGYQFIPNETTPPLMRPGTLPFLIENNAVQDSDDTQNISDYVTAAVRNSFRIQGIEAQFVQNVVQLITSLREQGTTNMQANPKQYVLEGTDPAKQTPATVQFDGVVVWANLEDQGTFYTIVRFSLVHYQLRESEQIVWQVGSHSSERIQGGEMQLHRVGATGNVRLCLSLAETRSAHVVLRSVAPNGSKMEAAVNLNCGKPGIIWEGDTRPNSDFVIENLPSSGPILLDFRTDHQECSRKESVSGNMGGTTHARVMDQVRRSCY